MLTGRLTAWVNIFKSLMVKLSAGLLQICLTWKSTARLLARSALFPASAMTMFGLACRCSSFTQFFARVNVSFEEVVKQDKKSYISDSTCRL